MGYSGTVQYFASKIKAMVSPCTLEAVNAASYLSHKAALLGMVAYQAQIEQQKIFLILR